jgi:hypothetical protein
MTKTKKNEINDVLFQKIGNTWFLFSEIDHEMYYTSLPGDVDPRKADLKLYAVIEDHLKRMATIKTRNAENVF